MNYRAASWRALGAALVVTLLGGLPPCTAAAEPRLIHGPQRSVSWQPVMQRGAALPLDLQHRSEQSWVVMRADRPAGIDYHLVHGNEGLYLPVLLDECSVLFGCNVHHAIHAQGLLIEAASHDFDRDGVPELIFALGHPALGVVVNVIRYMPAGRDAGRGNWQLVGRMEGPGGRIEVDADSLNLPYTSLGRVDHWRMVKGRFVRMTP